VGDFDETLARLAADALGGESAAASSGWRSSSSRNWRIKASYSASPISGWSST